MTRFFSWVLIFLLTACAPTVVKLEGEQVINARLTVQLSDAWNQIVIAGPNQPFSAWTQEGITLDHLRFWAGLASGKTLVQSPVGANVPAGQKAARMPTYVTGMQPDQLINLFEILYSADGSIVTMTKIGPTMFAGKSGVRFEFDIARKSDGLRLAGVGWVAVDRNELFAATFVAPKLSFFKRLLPKAERVVRTARIRPA